MFFVALSKYPTAFFAKQKYDERALAKVKQNRRYYQLAKHWRTLYFAKTSRFDLLRMG